MAITAIKDFKIKETYTKLVEKALFSYLWEGIYEPMFEILDIKPIIAKNSLNVIVEALRDGKLMYVDGGFKAKGKFTNAQSSHLIKWGAKWDKYQKMYRISRDMLPDDLRVYLAEAQIANKLKINQIQEYLRLVEENMPYIVESMVFDEEVQTILDDAGNEVKKNIKKMAVIEPELTEQQKSEIARAYTENMQDYVIKDFANERLPEMRRKIQELVLQGYRLDKVQELLEKEYGFMARKAKFLAQNETTIMLSEYKKVTYKEMGSDGFIWNTIMDGKERPLHKELNGTTWTWDNLPIIDERTGQRGLPGQAYNCRCELIPFFIDSPFKMASQKFGIDASENRISQYLNMKGINNISAKNSDENIDWITVHGNHIPILTGQTKEEAVKEFIEDKTQKHSKDTGDKTIAGVKRGKPMTRKQANEGRVNPNYLNEGGYRENCQICVATYEARLRGYNIEAKSFDFTNRKMLALAYNPALAYLDKETGESPNIRSSEANSRVECEKWLKANIKHGERYLFLYSPNREGAHVIQVQKKWSGQLEFYDPQNGKFSNEKLLNHVYYPVEYAGRRYGFYPRLLRVDDKELNFEYLNEVTKAVTKTTHD